jgi:hypothetical protein
VKETQPAGGLRLLPVAPSPNTSASAPSVMHDGDETEGLGAKLVAF